MAISKEMVLYKSHSTSLTPMSVMGGQLAQPPEATLAQFLRAYGEIGWFHAVVSLIARSVAEVEWTLNRIVDDEPEEITTPHPLKTLLNNPNDFQSGHDLMELTQIYEDLTGEGYWHLENNQLWSFPPHRMKVAIDSKEWITGYVFTGPDGDVPIPREDIIPFISPNPLMPWRGVGPAQAIGIELDTQAFALQTNRFFFYNGATMGIMISYPTDVPPEEYTRLKEQFQADHRGYGRSHKAIILTGGAQITDPNQKFGARDMDFVNMLKNNRDAILGAYGTPYSMLGGSEHVNRATAEAAQVDFASRVVRPRLQKKRDKLNKFLLPKFVDVALPKGAYGLQRSLKINYGYTTKDADQRVYNLKSLCGVEGDLTGNEDNMKVIWKAVGDSTSLQLDFDNPVPEDDASEAEMAVNDFKAGIITREEARGLRGYDAEAETSQFFYMPNNVIEQAVGEELEKPPAPVPFGGMNTDKPGNTGEPKLISAEKPVAPVEGKSAEDRAIEALKEIRESIRIKES